MIKKTVNEIETIQIYEHIISIKQNIETGMDSDNSDEINKSYKTIKMLEWYIIEKYGEINQGILYQT